jgi:hypothetical protein
MPLALVIIGIMTRKSNKAFGKLRQTSVTQLYI